MAKLIGKGTRNGEDVVIECVKKNNRVTVLKDGSEDMDATLIFRKHIIERDRANSGQAHLPEYPLTEIYSYQMAMSEVYFDAPPVFEGDVVVEEDDANRIY